MEKNQNREYTRAEKADLLYSKILESGISLSDRQISQFIQYYEMLVEKNKVMNLTAITDFQDVVVKHFADSLSISKVLNIGQNNSLIDVGTGAGFPGIPLKILYPDIKLVLLDSLKKRLLFLEEVINSIGLDKVETIHGRAEDLGHTESYREKFDICVSRAVANMSTLAELTLPFVSVGSHVVMYKGDHKKTSEEIEESKKAVSLLGGKISEIKSFELDEEEKAERTLVVITKNKKTPEKYPRKAGTPSKEPIK